VAWVRIIAMRNRFGPVHVVGGCQTQFAPVSHAKSQSVAPSMASVARETLTATRIPRGQNLVVVACLTRSAQANLVQQENAGQSMAIAEQEMLIATAMPFGHLNAEGLRSALAVLAGRASVDQLMAIVEQDLTTAMDSPLGQRRVVALLAAAMGTPAPRLANAAHSTVGVVKVHRIATQNRSGALLAQSSKTVVGVWP